MTVSYLTHPDCALHEMGPGHFEQLDRIRAIHQALQEHGLLQRMRALEPGPASREQLLRVHAPGYLDALEKRQPQPGQYQALDADTVMNSHTWQAALMAAGAVVLAVDEIMAGRSQRAFCNIRPPGHHAERDRAMGFCFLNNVAVAAAHALHQHGLKKVAIVDFDVHHGNGTENIFHDDPRVMLCSTFQSPLYPYMGEKTGNEHIINVPLWARTNSTTYRTTFTAKVIPPLKAFQPELVLFSAGFDAHQDDPLASLLLVDDDYEWITRTVLETTADSAKGRAVSLLEGGYHLPALASSASKHVGTLISAG
jgi:acetoin utilization deacetylase AcuC-like enzyme